MFDSPADLVVAIGFVAAIIATAVSLRFPVDVRTTREAVGAPAVLAAVAVAGLVGSTVATIGVFVEVWFTFTPGALGGGVSPLVFATWLAVFAVSARETLRAAMILLRPSGCAPTGSAAP